MAVYVKIKKYEQGDIVESYIEPLDSLAVALEEHIHEETEENVEIRLSTVELTEEEYQEIADTEGY